MNCNHGFHMTLAEDLSPIRNGKPKWVCPVCSRNRAHEKFLEACMELGIDPKAIDPNEYKTGKGEGEC